MYQELNAYYSKKTIFNILKIERNENRHSAFLAWLLDVNGSHGLGAEPLKKLMRFLYLKSEENRYDSCFLLGNYLVDKLEVSTEKYVELDKENGRIDVYLEFGYRYDASDKNTKRFCVIIENKMFTKEHGKQTELYRDWALKSFEKKDIIGVFLAPNRIDKCSGDIEDFKFLKINYQDLLDYVLEPLLLIDMSQEARSIIQDYVLNLEQPLKDESHNVRNKVANNSNADTILAVSKTKHNQFLQLYNGLSSLLDIALIAKGLSQGKDEKIKIVYGKDLVNMEDGLKPLMIGFWDSNEGLLRMIMNVALRRDDSKEYSAAVNDLLGIKESNRDNTRYFVYDEDNNLINEYKNSKEKPVPKSLASYYIFKAWLDKNKDATIDKIREAFPVESILQYEKYPYQYLFYWCDDIDKARKQGPADNATYYKASIDEKIDGKKYLQWDFYGCDTPYYLKINKEGSNKKEKVLSMKMWLKDEFDHLVAYAKEQHGISVKEQ